MTDPRELHEAMRRALARAETRTVTPDETERMIQRAFRARRRRRVRTAVILTVLLAGCTAAAALWMRDVTNPAVVVCFAAADVTSNRAGADSLAPPTAEDCVPVWESGEFGTTEAPDLTACVGPEGVLWVFPSDDPNTCESLGLALPNPVPDDHPSFRVRNAILGVLGRCDPIAESVETVRDALAAHDLSDWEVRVQPDLTGSCATIAIDDANHVIWIVPIDRGE